MNEQHLHFIITGGTFDGALKETGAVPTSTVVGSYLASSIHSAFSYSLDIPFLKDSRDISDGDRGQICDLIVACGHDRIVVTHGTFTLVQTAQLIATRCTDGSRTIIVTGAMTPFEKPNSDAPFNLGFACSAALMGRVGTWVAMHGRLWRPHEVVKNVDADRFIGK